MAASRHGCEHTWQLAGLHTWQLAGLRAETDRPVPAPALTTAPVPVSIMGCTSTTPVHDVHASSHPLSHPLIHEQRAVRHVCVRVCACVCVCVRACVLCACARCLCVWCAWLGELFSLAHANAERVVLTYHPEANAARPRDAEKPQGAQAGGGRREMQTRDAAQLAESSTGEVTLAQGAPHNSGARETRLARQPRFIRTGRSRVHPVPKTQSQNATPKASGGRSISLAPCAKMIMLQRWALASLQR